MGSRGASGAPRGRHGAQWLALPYLSSPSGMAPPLWKMPATPTWDLKWQSKLSPAHKGTTWAPSLGSSLSEPTAATGRAAVTYGSYRCQRSGRGHARHVPVCRTWVMTSPYLSQWWERAKSRGARSGAAQPPSKVISLETGPLREAAGWEASTTWPSLYLRSC